MLLLHHFSSSQYRLVRDLKDKKKQTEQTQWAGIETFLRV